MNKLNFSAIDPYVVSNIVRPTEEDSRKGFIKWGDKNLYPQYIKGLYTDVTILKAAVDLSVDYTIGDGIEIDDVIWNERVNDSYSTEEFLRHISKDYFIYGGFAINVLRNSKGDIVSLYSIPFERLRTNEKNTHLWYSKDWTNSRLKPLEYNSFNEDNSSIYYYNNSKGISTYPIIPWSSAVISAEIQKKINEYNINNLANGFFGSYLINFNNGTPTDQEKEEIEDYFCDKFGGTENAGRIVFSYSEDKAHSAELKKLEVDDFSAKYEALSNRSKSEILSAFHLNPRLLGSNEDATGFTTTEFEDAFRLYNRTVIKPVQRRLCKAIQDIIQKDVVIKPFTI